MSRRSSSLPYHYHHEHSGRRDERRHPVAAASGQRGRDYTFAHAGRQIRLGPIAFWVVVGTLVIMGIWTITTATYFAFRDDVLTRLIARQANMQFGYEDRIAELRVQIDRISSRQLLDQEQYEQKLEQVLRRQATLEIPRLRIQRPARSDADRIDQAGQPQSERHVAWRSAQAIAGERQGRVLPSVGDRSPGRTRVVPNR